MRADPRSCNSSSRSRTPAMARDSVLAGFVKRQGTGTPDRHPIRTPLGRCVPHQHPLAAHEHDALVRRAVGLPRRSGSLAGHRVGTKLTTHLHSAHLVRAAVFHAGHAAVLGRGRCLVLQGRPGCVRACQAARLGRARLPRAASRARSISGDRSRRSGVWGYCAARDGRRHGPIENGRSDEGES